MNKLVLINCIFVILLGVSLAYEHKINKNKNPKVDPQFARSIDYTVQVNNRADVIGKLIFKKLAAGKPVIPKEKFDEFLKSINPDLSIDGTVNLFRYDYDENHDGTISPKEAGIALRNILVAVAADKAFKHIEFVAKGQFKKQIEETVDFIADKYIKVREIVRSLFKVADVNNDGALEKEEFFAVFKFKPKSKSIDEFWAQIDKDGDGKIDVDQAFDLYALLVLDMNEQSKNAMGGRVGHGQSHGHGHSHSHGPKRNGGQIN
jgi:Ca2+-binding EF-hand superfamily protein